MTHGSKKTIVEHNTSLSSVYGKAVDNEINGWLEISDSTVLPLINNIYVQTRSLAMIELGRDLIGNDLRLAEMAADPEIQNEIRLINQEFAVTEEDGLPDQL